MGMDSWMSGQVQLHKVVTCPPVLIQSNLISISRSRLIPMQVVWYGGYSLPENAWWKESNCLCMHHKLYMEQSLINQLPKKIVWRWSGQWKSGNIIWRGDDFMCIPLILPYHGHLTAPRPALFWPIGYFDCSLLTFKSTIGKAVLTKDLTPIPSQYWSTFHPSCDPCLYVYSEPVSNGFS